MRTATVSVSFTLSSATAIVIIIIIIIIIIVVVVVVITLRRVLSLCYKCFLVCRRRCGYWKKIQRVRSQ